MSGILFFIFASCHPLSKVRRIEHTGGGGWGKEGN